MRLSPLANELERIADEARQARARLVELIRQTVELREQLTAATAIAATPGEAAPARKLHSVQ